MKHNQKLKQALQELDALKERVERLMKTELEVGKWYKGTVDFESLIFITEIENVDSYEYYNRIHGYGFISGEWNYLSHLFSNTEHEESLVEATPQEVEEALIKESKRRGYKKGVTCLFGNSKYKRSIIEDNIKYTEWQGTMVLGMGINVIFRQDTGEWAEIIEVDKFAELKEAESKGEIIECKAKGFVGAEWALKIHKQFDDTNFEYLIKPEEEPKVGDVVKAWDNDESDFLIGYLNRIDSGTNFFPFVVSNNGFKNAKPLTKQEAIELLFGKENEFNQTDLQTMAVDIESLKEKYPQYNIAITVEDKV